MTLTVGSLFSGIGGFDAAFEAAGAEVLWQVETDPMCNRILERHWPNARRYGDVTTQGAATLAPVDLICGGFPCQDISIAGGREGLAGERSGLWHEFARILAELRPRYVVIENVPGLLSSNEGRDMGTILRALGDMGYGWAYRVLDAQWAGLAQRRDRVFIVACLGDWTGATQILLEPEGGLGDSPPRREAGARLATDVAAGADRPGLKRHDDVALQLTAHEHRDGDMDTNYVIYDGMIVRRLTPLECERLQGFPDGHTAHDAAGKAISDTARYRILGNAVAVPVAQWIAERIVEATEYDPLITNEEDGTWA